MKHGTQILLVFCLAVTPAGCGGRTELEAPPEVVRDEDRARVRLGGGFGIVAEETPVTDITGTKDITVHGAWTMVTWEQTSLYEVNGITLVT